MKYLLFFSFIFFSLSVFAQSKTDYSVYLIGDAGEDTVSGKALLMLKEELLNNSNSAIIFLGDNVYPAGLKANDRKSASHLESQLSILKEYKGQAYFIPGNHDWAAQTRLGLNRIQIQKEYVNEYLKMKSTVANKNESTFLPVNGLPGPASVMLNNDLMIIMIDTQWFLHRNKKGKIGSKKNTEKLFYSHLDSLLNVAKRNNQQVIIAAHHPIFTNGQHSRSRQPFRFLINKTPFFILGFAGMYRLYFQDISQPKYKKMRERMLTIFNKYDNIIYASGHDHNLQCIKGNENRYIVSGSGSKLSPLNKRKRFDSVFEDDKQTGFVKIIYKRDGTHTTIVYRVGEEPKVINGF